MIIVLRRYATVSSTTVNSRSSLVYPEAIPLYCTHRVRIENTQYYVDFTARRSPVSPGQIWHAAFNLHYSTGGFLGKTGPVSVPVTLVLRKIDEQPRLENEIHPVGGKRCFVPIAITRQQRRDFWSFTKRLNPFGLVEYSHVAPLSTLLSEGFISFYEYRNARSLCDWANRASYGEWYPFELDYFFELDDWLKGIKTNFPLEVIE